MLYFCCKIYKHITMLELRKTICKYLREIADRIDSNTSEISENEALEILKIISHEPLSKERACRFLNLSRSRFDDLVREGKLPKGRKRVGFKELVWWKDELDNYLNTSKYVGEKK